MAGFQIDQEPDTAEVIDHPSAPKRPKGEGLAIQGLMVALSALSKRTLIALSNLFALLTILSVWWLFMSIPSPDVHQLFALGGYSIFVLAANWIVRR